MNLSPFNKKTTYVGTTSKIRTSMRLYPGRGTRPPSLFFWTRGEGLDPPAFRTARLGLRPALPLCDPTAERPPPLTPVLQPARCAQGLVLGVEKRQLNVALHGSAELAASLPRTSRKKLAFLPSRSDGAASAGVVLLSPCMRHRRSACTSSSAVRLPAHRVSRSALCRAACCPFGDAPYV